MKEKKSKVRVEDFKSKLKGMIPPCLGCKSDNYHVVNNFGNIKMSESLKLSPGGLYTATVIVICKNCGLISFYAVEVLNNL